MAQLRILGGDAHGTVAGPADPVLLAPQRQQRPGGHGNGVRSHGDGFGKVGGDPQSSGDDQINVRSQLIQTFPGPVKGVDGGHSGGVPEHLGSGTGAAAPAVYGDKVRLGKDTAGQVLFDVSRRNLNADGPAVRRIAELLHQIPQIFLGGDVLKAGGGMDVLACRTAPNLGDFRGDLFSRQMAAHAGFGALADFDFNGPCRF